MENDGVRIECGWLADWQRSCPHADSLPGWLPPGTESRLEGELRELLNRFQPQD